MNESTPLVEIRSVSYSYGHTVVLEDVSFPINQGDFLSLIGPNGSGKTTLIKIILGLMIPSKGEIRIMGKPVADFNEWQKVGYVPQKATHIDPLFPVSVREVVKMGLVSHLALARFKKEDEEHRIRNALSRVGMENYANWRIGKLSGGQQQRVFIARAIVNQPCLLFLDEPTIGVDSETQGHFYDMLDTLNKDELITIVLVTHDIGVVNKYVSRVACLNQNLEYHGTHAEFCQSDVFKKMLTEGHHIVSHRH